MSPKPPVIVIGMHRSGTSALTRLLQQSGLFMGRGASRNEEAAFTNALNAWIFRQASATWDRPETIDELFADDVVWPELVDYVGGLVRGSASVRFLGAKRWWRCRGLHGLDSPWGWKDPRNTWTLPLWLTLFPDARVLHIVRHGVPVAESLRVRREKAVAARLARYRRRRSVLQASPFGPKRGGFGDQPRCRTLEGGFSLWEDYVARARRHVEERGDLALDLRFEDLVTEPHVHLQRVLEFCDVTGDKQAIELAVESLDAQRATAWQADERLREFATQSDERLAAFGYTASGPTEL